MKRTVTLFSVTILCIILALASMFLMAAFPSPDPRHEQVIERYNVRYIDYKNWEVGTAYDFASTRSAGVLPYGTYADFRTVSGITATCTGNTASVLYYTRNGSARPGTLSLEQNGKSIWQSTLTSADTPVLLPALGDGTYFVRHTDTNGDMCAIRLEVQDGKAQACRSALDIDRINTFRQVLSAIKPENALSVSDIFYPAGYSHQDETIETAKWAALSHELLPGSEDSYTDSQKVYAFARWIAGNIAYDSVVTKKHDGRRRAHYAVELGDKDAWKNPKYFAWETQCGVCQDYATILAIMCREHGIPATSAGSDTDFHAWCAVFLDGNWEPVDITDFNEYIIKQDDNLLDNDPGNRVPVYAPTMKSFLRADMIRSDPEDAGVNLSDKASYEWCVKHNAMT